MLNPPESYGADASGLICAYQFCPDSPARQVSGTQALHCLQHDESNGFVWLHLNLSHVATEKWLREHLQLPVEFYEALHEGSRSTRIEHADQHLIAIINDVVHDFSYEASDISTLWVCASEKLIVTVRRTFLKSVDRLRQAVNQGAQLQSTAELLSHLLHDQADVLTGIVRQLNRQVDDTEDALLAGRLNHKRARLGQKRRVLVRLQRLLAPEPAALFRLLQKPPRWMSDDARQELRQATEEFAEVLRDMHSLQERIKLLQEELATVVNEQNNRSLFVLTIVTVLALPINLTAGLMGMNVGGIPFAQNEYGFWIVVLMLAIATGIAAWLAFRRRDPDA